MAKIRAYDFNIQTGNVSSVSVVMPPHETGDLLFVVAGKDDATGGDPTTVTSGWTRGGSGVSSGTTTAAVRCAWFYKIAASAAEPDLVITSTDADSWSIIAVSIEGAHATPIDASTGNGNTDSTGAPFAATGLTTNYNNSLVLFAAFSGGAGAPVHYPGLHLIGAVDSGNEGVCLAYTVKETAGAVTDHNFYADATNQNLRLFCVAIRDDGNGHIPGYLNRDYATLINPWRGATNIITSDTLPTDVNRYLTLGKDAVAYVVNEDVSGPTFVDLTTAANDATNTDVVLFPATEAIHDYVAFGYDRPFMALVFDRASATLGVAGIVAWEYWNGSAWVVLTGISDATTGFTAAAADGNIVRWSMPPNFNWVKLSINGSAELFFVRARVTTVYTTNPVVDQVYVGGAATVYDAFGSSADAGVIPFENNMNITPSTSTVTYGAAYRVLGQSVTLTDKIIVGTYMFTLPRDGLDLARFKEGGGIALLFADSSFNRRVWIVGNYADKQTVSDRRNRFAIDWEQSVDTTCAKTTTLPTDTLTDVAFAGLFPRGAGSMFFGGMLAVGTVRINGGTEADPIELSDFLALGDAWPAPLFRDGEFIVPVTFGGDAEMHAVIDGFTFTFPKVATPYSDLYNLLPSSMAHIDEGKLGFIIDLDAEDALALTNGKITSESTWRFEVLSGSSASADYDFTNLLIINANVTLRATHTWQDMQFQNCPSFITNGATIQSCSFSNTKVTVSSPANASLISNCSFVSSGTGYAIEIGGTAADFTLTNVDFSGYAGNGSTGNEAIFVNIASGTVNISISGGSTPGIRTAGATVNVVNAVTVKVTAKDANTGAVIQNARVYLVADTGGDLPVDTVILSGLTDVNGILQTTSFAFTNTQPVKGKVRKSTSSPLYKTSPLSGNITSGGFDTTSFMIGDE